MADEQSKQSMASEHGVGIIKWLVALAVLGGLGWAGYKYWNRPKDSTVEFKTSKVVRGDITIR